MMSGSKRSTGKSGRGSSMNFTKRIDPGRMLRRSLSGARSRFVGNIGSGDMGYQAISKGYRLARGLARGFNLSKKEKESSAASSSGGSPVQSATSLENFKNFKIVVFRKLDTIIDLLGKLQLSKPIAAPPSASGPPVEEGAPEKDKPLNLGFLAGLLSGLAMKYFIAPLVRIFKNIIGMITRLWDGLKRLFMSVVNKIKSIFRSLWRMVTAVKNLFVRLVRFIAGLIPKIAGALKAIGKSIGKFFKDAFRAAKDYIIKRLLGVANFIAKMAARALSSLGKMLLNLVPGAGALAALLKGNPKAAKALNAAKPKPPSVPVAAAAAKGTGNGMKFLGKLAGLPGLGTIIAAGIAISDMQKADKDLLDEKLTPIEHKKKVGTIAINAIGSLAGGTFGAWAGAALGAPVFLVGAIPGAFIGGVLGSLAGEWLAGWVFEKFGGDYEKFGEFIDNLSNLDPGPANEKVARHIGFLQTYKNLETNPKNKQTLNTLGKRLEAMKENGDITDDEYKKTMSMIENITKGPEKVKVPAAPAATPVRWWPATPAAPAATPAPTPATPAASAPAPADTPAASAPAPADTPAATPTPIPAPVPEPQPPQQQASAVQPVPPAPTSESQNPSNVVINRQTNVSQNNTVLPVSAASRAIPPPMPSWA